MAGVSRNIQVLQELETRALVCTQCGLAETRTQVVFGVGDPEARLMFVGEGPGAEEDRLGEPFVVYTDDWRFRYVNGPAAAALAASGAQDVLGRTLVTRLECGLDGEPAAGEQLLALPAEQLQPGNRQAQRQSEADGDDGESATDDGPQRQPAGPARAGFDGPVVSHSADHREQLTNHDFLVRGDRHSEHPVG